jgi:hypothetical protein
MQSATRNSTLGLHAATLRRIVKRIGEEKDARNKVSYPKLLLPYHSFTLKLRRWIAEGPLSCRTARCARVPYPLFVSNP